MLGGIDLIRPLSRAGIRCAVVARPGAAIAASRHVTSVIDPGGPAPDEALLLNRLLAFAASEPVPPTLFFESDEDLLFVSRNRDRLAGCFRFAIEAPARVEALVDKAAFGSLAQALGLPVPESRVLHPDRTPPPGRLDLPFPIVVKSVTRGRGWERLGTPAKALRVDTPPALRDVWGDLARTGDTFLAQRLVPGPETRLESYHVHIDGTGAVAAEFTGRKIRTFPVEHGHSTALEITAAADVAAVGRDSVRRLGLRGTAKLDFKRDPDGLLHLLEVNPRFSLWHHLAAAAGMNIPALVHADLTGAPRPPIRTARVGARWCRLSRDFHAARACGIGFPTWAAWALTCDATTPPLDDPGPFLRSALGHVLHRHRVHTDRKGGALS